MERQKNEEYKLNEKKKEYLKGYEKAVRQLKRIEMEIQEIRLNRIYPSIAIDGMTHASNSRDLSEYIVLLEKEERKCKRAQYKKFEKCKEIKNKIEQLKNEDEKDVLFYRYIKLMKWEEICNELQCSWRQVHRIHSKALSNIIIT